MAVTIDEYLKLHPGTSALVLSHLSLLTEQSYSRFRSRIPRRSVGIMQGKRTASMMNDIIVSTMQTARSEKHITRLKTILCKPISLLVVDETHMLPTKSYEQIQEHFAGIPLIGYTATPFREKRIMTNSFDKISFTISLQELIDQGYLVTPELRTIQSPGLNPIDVMSTVMGVYQAQEAGGRAIVFMKTVEDAKTLRCALETQGITSRTVTGDVGPAARREIFESFRTGETKVLTTVDVLTAGFDAPETEAIFMPYGTKSPTQYIQRIGRGLRPAEGKTSCRIYMLGDAPALKSGFFEKMHKMVFKAGQTKPQDSFRDDLELSFAAPESEVYRWTQMVVDAVSQMERLGMTTFARALDMKEFPDQYLRSIRDLIARLPKKKTPIPHGTKPATEAQQTILFEAGFGSKLCSELTKAEATMMIGTLYNRHNDPRGDASAFTVTEGKYTGKHVSELPFPYRAVILKRYPDSPLATQINTWQSRRRRA